MLTRARHPVHADPVIVDWTFAAPGASELPPVTVKVGTPVLECACNNGCCAAPAFCNMLFTCYLVDGTNPATLSDCPKLNFMNQ